MTQEEKIKEAKRLYESANADQRYVLESLFPELKENEDKKMMNQLHSWMKEFGGAEEYTEKVYNWLQGLIKVQCEHKPAWSEEDDIFFKAIIRDIENTQYISDDAKKDRINWLKSLKDRVHFKQEWSEEDERKRIETIELLETANHPNKIRSNGKPIDFTENINWLKSLRPQTTWKPSEEEMKALAYALSLANNCGEEYAFDLRTLQDQLKKLK